MQSKFFVFVIQFLIFLSEYKFINALCGEDVRAMEPNEFPAFVCLLFNRPDHSPTENVICSGTLYSMETVVTSEQCLYMIGQQGFVINIGSSNIIQSINYSPVWWISYDSWAHFMQYPSNNQLNDIGVIRVHSVVRTANISPMPLSSRSPTSEFFGMMLDLTGCGKNILNVVPEFKQTTVGLILSKQECETRTSLIRGTFLPIPDYTLCSLSYPTTFLSHGDTGGGLMLDDTLVAINVGTSPYLHGAYHPDKVNVHLSIDNYRPFLALMETM